MNIRNRVLGTSTGYWSWKRLVAADRANRIIAEDYIQPQRGERILDVGCGVGDIARYMGSARYVGVDSNASYIERAKKNTNGDATFVNSSVEELPGLSFKGFDKVVIIGVLHHLDDDQVAGLMEALPAVLKPGGLLIAAENAWIPDQATTARVLIALDRGRHVRTIKEYESYATPYFSDVSTEVRDDFLRIPYTYVITKGVVRPPETDSSPSSPSAHLVDKTT